MKGFACFSTALVVTCVTFGALNSRAATSRGKPIQFGAPSASVSTNLTQGARKSDGLKELQDGLVQPLHDSIRPGSLDGAPIPMQVPGNRTQPAKRDRSKELLDIRKNWGVADEKDLKDEAERNLSGAHKRASEQEITPESLGLSAEDQFLYDFLRSDNKPGHSTKNDRPRKKNDRSPDSDKDDSGDTERNEDSRVAERLRQSEQEFNNFIHGGKQNTEKPLGFADKSFAVGDFFGLGGAVRPTPEQEALRKERMREYREIYGMSGGGMNAKEMFESVMRPPATATASTAPPVPTFNNPSTRPGTSLLAAPGSGPTANFGAAGPALPSFASSGLPSANPQLIPKIELAPRVLPSKPVGFEAPKRPF